jgi:hypothetical protein
MPYFYNNEVNILFIHIPKTGGTSLEKYFEKKYEIPLDKDSLYTTNPKDFYNGISYQHQFYKTFKENKPLFRIDYESIQIISIVRNPYNRILSDLFFKNLIKENFTKLEVYDVIKKYLEDANNLKHDNHRVPQYLFLMDENDNISANIKILKTEKLNDEMKELGYSDFNQSDQVSNVKNKNYYSYLNIESVKLINHFYDKDFEYFNYNKISTMNDIDLSGMIVNEEIFQSKKLIISYLANYFESIHEYAVSKNNLIDKNTLNEIIFPLHREIADNYTYCYEKVVEELSMNYKDVIE